MPDSLEVMVSQTHLQGSMRDRGSEGEQSLVLIVRSRLFDAKEGHTSRASHAVSDPSPGEHQVVR